jgi:ribose transport system permease protein
MTSTALSRSRRLRFVSSYAMLIVWLIIILLFSLWIPSLFATSNNLRVVLSNEAIGTVVALGLVLPLAAGVYDLSVTGVMSISAAVAGGLMASHGWSPVQAIVAAIFVGILVGAINALVIVRLQVDSFIATLGMSSILEALTYRAMNGQDILRIPTGFENIGQNELLSLPLPVWFMAALALVLYFLLERTPFGRYLHATGLNPDAARLSGVPVGRLRVIALLASGALAALAGVLLTAQLGSAPVNAGNPYLLPAFAAALLGSTQFRPGRVNVLGTVVAIYTLATGVKGLELRYPGNPWIDGLFQGVTLILAVVLSTSAARRIRSRRRRLSDAS